MVAKASWKFDHILLKLIEPAVVTQTMKSTVNTLWNALLTAVVVTMLAGLFIAAMPPVYRATATVKGNADGMLIIQSGDLLAGVMKSANVNPEDLQGWFEDFSNTDVDVSTLLQQKLFVSTGERQDWIDITVEAQVAESAALLANEIAKAYLDRTRENAVTPALRDRLFAEVEAADRSISEFVRQHPESVSFDDERTRLSRRLTELQRLLIPLNNKLRGIDDQLLKARQGDVRALRNNVVAGALASRNDLQMRRAELSGRYGDQHQKMVEISAKLRVAEKRLIEAVKIATLAVQQQREIAAEAVAEIEAQRQSVIDRQSGFKDLQAEHHILLQNRQTALDRFNGVIQEQRRYEFSEAAPPAKTPGISQLVLLGLVFLASFVLVALLVAIRQRSR